MREKCRQISKNIKYKRNLHKMYKMFPCFISRQIEFPQSMSGLNYRSSINSKCKMLSSKFRKYALQPW